MKPNICFPIDMKVKLTKNVVNMYVINLRALDMDFNIKYVLQEKLPRCLIAVRFRWFFF